MSEYASVSRGIQGTANQRLRLTNRRDIAACGADMAQAARRELLILDPTLEPALYDREPFRRAVRRLALARPDWPVRILVLDPRAALQGGHRLIELARRLTSRIAIQRLDENDRDRLDAFLVVDARAYVHRGLAANMEAIANFKRSA